MGVIDSQNVNEIIRRTLSIINPKIIGDSLSISPLLVIFAVTVGGAYFGVLGMFLAVPVFTVIKLLIEEYIEYKSEKSVT